MPDRSKKAGANKKHLLSTESFGGLVTGASNVSPTVKKKNAGNDQEEEKPDIPDVAASLALKYAFGCTSCIFDSVQSIQLRTGKDRDESGDKIIYRSGKRICIHDMDTENVSIMDSQSKGLFKINHFSLSPLTVMGYYISICEMLTDGKTQISIYSLTTMKKMYTLANALLDSRLESVRGEFTYSSFCGDMKYLASLFVAEDVESHVILWLWDKEKSYKSDKLFVGKSFKISCPLSTDVMFTSSGPNFVKLHYIGTNNMLTQTNLVPIPKERGMKIEKVIDQVWLHAMGARQKLAVLVDFEGTDVNKRFVVYIFEATEDSVLRDNDAFSPKLELKLSIPVYLLEGTFGFKLNRVVCTPRGFMLLGLRGYVLLYEKTEGKQVNYFHLCSLHTEDEGNLIAGTLAPSEGRLVVLSSNEENSFSAAETSTRLLTLPLPDTNDDRNKEVVVSNSEDITANGYHSQGVLGADMALQRPLLVTISSEGYARVWSYDKPVRCEFVEKLDDSPLAVAVHHNGLQVLISFRDKVRLYNILKNKLTVYKDTSLRSCQILRFSCGCQLWAGAQSSNIYIFDTKTFTMLNTLHASGSRQGVIRSLAWAPGDQALFCGSADGHVLAWDTADPNNCVDISKISINITASQISDLTMSGDAGLFPQRESEEPNLLVYATQDGNMRVTEWFLGDFGPHAIDRQKRTFTEENTLDFTIPGDGSAYVTSFVVTADKSFLIVGTNQGDVRVYSWNRSPTRGMSVSMSPFREVRAHAGPVATVRETPLGGVVSVGEDGTVFVWVLEREVSFKADDTKSGNVAVHMESVSRANAEPWEFNRDIICISPEESEEYTKTLETLRRDLVEISMKGELQRQKVEGDHKELLKNITGEHTGELNAERKKFDSLQQTFSARVQELQNKQVDSDEEHQKIVEQIKNNFEKKLTEQLESYDALYEVLKKFEMEKEVVIKLLKEKNQDEVDKIKKSNEDALQKKEIELNRVKIDKTQEKRVFQEVLDQQEDEHTEELRDHVAAFVQRLKAEKASFDMHSADMQGKLTLSIEAQNRLKENNERMEKMEKLVELLNEQVAGLKSQIELNKINMKERVIALAEKEKIILDLRNEKKILENFKFVLYHRLQLLSAERGPITSHIDGLEKHIKKMYEELVKEQEEKKTCDVASEQDHIKIRVLNSEAAKLRTELKRNEEYIAAFKRELSNIVSAGSSKELEEGAKSLYRKYIIGDVTPIQSVGKNNHNSTNAAPKKSNELLEEDEDDDDDDDDSTGDHTNYDYSSKTSKKMSRVRAAEVEVELVENAKEADRRRVFVEVKTKNLRGRLLANKRQADQDNKVRLAENSSLMYECNDLRWQVKDLERRLQMAEASYEQLRLSYKTGSQGKEDSISIEPHPPVLSLELPREPIKYDDNFLELKGIHKGIHKGSNISQDGSMSDSYGDFPLSGRSLPKLSHGRNKSGSNESLTSRSVTKMAREMDAMVMQLDEAHKEKDMYRIQASRLKRQLMQLQPVISEALSHNAEHRRPAKSSSLTQMESRYFEDRLLQPMIGDNKSLSGGINDPPFRIIGKIPKSRR